MLHRYNYDVVVVGAGPAGCMAAKYAAKRGASTLILEEDPEIGEPVQCAGLISERAIEESEIKNSHHSFIDCLIKGAIVYPPSHKHELRIESPSKRAFSIRRSIFDKLLAKEALKEGPDIFLRCKFTSILKSKREGQTSVKVKALSPLGEMEIATSILVAADGVKSRVAKMIGLRAPKNVNILSCVQIEGKYEIEDSHAEIFVGKNVAPGFFAWTIPVDIDKQIARIGLCIDKQFSPDSNPLLFFKKNLSEHPIISKKYRGSISEFTAGAIPIPNVTRKQKTVKIDKGVGVLLVGDAAAQVKPITGGGVYYGMKCGKIAGEIAAKASLTNDLLVLKEYEKRWRKVIGKEIAFGLKVHRLRGVLDDEDFDLLCHSLSQSQSDVLQLIAKKGDMDYPSTALLDLLKKPQIFKMMTKNITKYLYIK